MNRFSLVVYERADGRSQVREYLHSSSAVLYGRASALMKTLAEEGDRLGRPRAAHLGGGIYELRVKARREHHRILYFFHGSIIIMTNAFLKKTDRVPEAELERAKNARADWLRRFAETENEKEN